MTRSMSENRFHNLCLDNALVSRISERDRFMFVCRLHSFGGDVMALQAGKRPHPEDIHPAFLGYFHRPRSPKAAWNPTVI